MKRVKYLALIAFLFSLISAHADGRERPISFAELPEAAQTFCTTYFGDLTVAYIVADAKFTHTEYEVTYTDRTEVDFRTDGSWKSVERKYSSVPAAIVPAQIADFVAANELFRQQFIRKIERNSYTWEIELSSGLEVKFDAKFNVIGYDD